MGKINNVLCHYLHDKRRFADLYNAVCFQGIQIIDAEKLLDGSEQYAEPETEGNRKGAGERYRHRMRDIKMYLQSGVTLQILALENQNQVDYVMPFRCMQYDAMEYSRQLDALRKHNDRENNYTTAAERLCRVRKTDRLIPVYTLCLYHGEAKWDGPRTLKDMMNFGTEEALKAFFADYSMHLYCVNENMDFSMFHTELRELFTLLKFRKDREGLQKLVSESAIYKNIDMETARVAAILMDTEDIWLREDKYRNKKEGEVTYNMCQAVQEWAEEERMIGITQGEKKTVINLICRKIKKGKSLSVIAEELEQDYNDTRPLYEACQKCAPEYDCDRIYELIKDMK